MGKRLDLVGKKFGRLTVIAFSHIGKGQNSYWLCKCDCGTDKVISGKSFTKGRTVSCGCFHKEYMKTHAASINNLTRLPYGEACFNVVWKRYQASALRRNHEFSLSKEEFKKITSQNCHYCGQAPSTVESLKGANGDFVYNGIDRIDNIKGYNLTNCVPCCTDCNWLKGSMDYDKFIDRVHRISSHRRNNG